MQINQEHITHIKSQFANLKSKEDLIDLLSAAKDIIYGKKCMPFRLKALTYYADPAHCKFRYSNFSIKKKSGGERIIHAPAPGLKSLLRALNFVLQCVSEPHAAAMGFVSNRSIVDNAAKHVAHNYVYNLDLKDFFFSFDRNRVKLGFMYEPFNLNGKKEPLAFLLASLCTHPFEMNAGETKTLLPQGSPTSPTITNVLCKKLDRRLTGLANRFGATYTRYADDITFSSPHNIYKNADFIDELHRLIEDDQTLVINPKKTRLQKQNHRQEVTGLTVNEKVNVRRAYVKQLRNWLFLWNRYGLEKAENIFLRDYRSQKMHVKPYQPNMQNVIFGKLEFLKMVKGAEDSTYLSLKRRYDNLMENDSPIKVILDEWEAHGAADAIKTFCKRNDYHDFGEGAYIKNDGKGVMRLIYYSEKNELPFRKDIVRQMAKDATPYPAQCKRLHELALRDIEGINDGGWLDGLGLVREKPESTTDVKKISKIRIHDPAKLVGWLNLFNKEGSPIKYSVHSWDDRTLFPTYDIFIEKLMFQVHPDNSDFRKMPQYSPDLFFNKINPFLLQQHLSSKQVNNDITFKWGRNEIKIGWQYPDVIRKWSLENYDEKGKDAITPFAMEIPKELRPQGRINGKTIKYFEQVVNLFKREIEFRDNDLFIGISVLIANELRGYDINQEELEGLKGCSFFTNTEMVLKAIQIIFGMIRSRPTSRKVSISCRLNHQDKCFDLKIMHHNSFSNKELTHPKIQLKTNGDLKNLQTTLISLCDLSMSSKFKNDKGQSSFKQVHYLYPGVSEKSMSPMIIDDELVEDTQGTLFTLIFPVK